MRTVPAIPHIITAPELAKPPSVMWTRTWLAMLTTRPMTLAVKTLPVTAYQVQATARPITSRTVSHAAVVSPAANSHTAVPSRT